MTLTKLMLLYRHYQLDYDFRLKQISYTELEEKVAHNGEWLID